MVAIQKRTIQLANTGRPRHKKRIPGPGASLRASSEVLPLEMAYRAISTCTKTLMTQPKMMRPRKMKPALAPVCVAAISSPEPTIEPARMSPGPRVRRMPKNVRGGSRTSFTANPPPSPPYAPDYGCASHAEHQETRTLRARSQDHPKDCASPRDHHAD